ncbi:MAG: M48 family metallopeptidase [Bryobacteraceae bacterium]
MKRAWAILAAGVLLACAAAAKDHSHLATGDTDNPGRGVNVYSLEREVELGRQMAAEVERQARLLDDPVVVEYVNRLSQNLVRNSDARVPFTVKVIDSSEVNAFALPGGFLFVNTGLILRAETEAELAGVLAHEIAHVAARHGTKQATRAELFNYVSLPLVFAGGWLGYAVRQLVGLAVPMGFVEFTRGMEKQADTLGLEYLYRSGYDPLAFVDFFERIETMQKTKPNLVARMFSTHPLTESRIKAAQKLIQHRLAPRSAYVVDTSEFQDVRGRLEQLEDLAGPRRRGDGPVLRRRLNSNPPPIYALPEEAAQKTAKDAD